MSNNNQLHIHITKGDMFRDPTDNEIVIVVNVLNDGTSLCYTSLDRFHEEYKISHAELKTFDIIARCFTT